VLADEEESSAIERSPCKSVRLSKDDSELGAPSPTLKCTVDQLSQNSCNTLTPTDRRLRSHGRCLESVQGLQLERDLEPGLDTKNVYINV